MPAAPSLPSKIQELKQRKALTAARKAAAKELKAKERQMTRLRKHLQKLKPADLAELVGLVPRYPLQKPPSRGLEGSGGEGGGDEGLKVEGGFTFGRLQGGFKGA